MSAKIGGHCATCAILCLAAALACSGENQIKSAPKAPASQALRSVQRQPTQARVKGLLWRVQGRRGVAFVTGTVPVVGAEFFPLDSRIEQAFTESDTLVLELHVPDADRQAAAEKLVTAARYPENDAPQNHLSPDTWVRLLQALPSANERAALGGFRPWFIAINLHLGRLAALGVDPDRSLESHFLRRAGARWVVSLEAVEDQVRTFQQMNDTLAEHRLLSVLEELPRLGPALHSAERHWRRGNAVDVAEVLTGTLGRDYPDVYARLWLQRSQTLAQALQQLLDKPKRYFVLVDAGLLVGKKSLLTQIQRLGASVEQL